MKRIFRVKRLEVAQYYLLGHTYKEIKEETGVSHWSIANIVGEIEDGCREVNTEQVPLTISRGTWKNTNVKFQGKARGTTGTMTVTFGGTMGSYRGRKESFQCDFVCTFNRQFGGKKWAS